jgi:hypothetical protein
LKEWWRRREIGFGHDGGAGAEGPETHVDLFQRDQSDFDGTFLLRGVIPGMYTVVAVEDAWGFDWFKAGVLARDAQKGQNVIVAKMRGWARD